MAPNKRPESKVHVETKTKETIDMADLEDTLNMGRSKSDLGFREKRFDTCKVGAGYASGRNCRNRRFLSVNLQLVCRDSMGTVEEAPTEYELRPVSSKSLMWKVGYYRGYSRTDSRGYTQVRLVTPGTSKRQSLLVKIGTRALQLQAADVRRIVLPKDWCI